MLEGNDAKTIQKNPESSVLQYFTMKFQVVTQRVKLFVQRKGS
jgi:hypothetical protein